VDKEKSSDSWGFFDLHQSSSLDFLLRRNTKKYSFLPILSKVISVLVVDNQRRNKAVEKMRSYFVFCHVYCNLELEKSFISICGKRKREMKK